MNSERTWVGTPASWTGARERHGQHESMQTREDQILIEAIPDAVLVLDAAGEVIRMNEAARLLLASPGEALPGLVAPPGEPASFAAGWSRAGFEAAWQRGAWRGWLTLPLAAGPTRCELNARRSTLDGAPVLVVSIREEADRPVLLDPAFNRLEVLIASSVDLVIVLDQTGRITFFSPNVQSILGYTPAELSGQNALDFVHPDELPLARELLARALAERDDEGFSWVMRIRNNLSDWRWLEASVRNQCANPHVAGLVINARDITGRLEAEAALRASEERFRVLVEQLPAAAYITSSDLTWLPIYVSPRLADIAGPGAVDAFRTGTWVERIHPDDVPAVDAANDRVADTPGPYRVEYRLRRDNGSYVWLRDDATPVYDEAGRFIAWQGLFADISGQVELNRELAAARDAAEESNRLKSAFLSMMSHELRTPLNAILGYAHLLLDEVDGRLNPGQARSVEHITNGAERLLGLINDLLDLSRIEAGGLELSDEDVDLARIILGVQAEMTPLAAARSLTIRTELAADLPAPRGDGARIRQILLNLLSNAVKFTERGEIRISAAAAPDEVRIAVSDTGIGIAREMLPRIFDEFRQVDIGAARNYGGSGLGLAIARQLAELHGGSLTVESTPGAGSTFTLTLPLARQASAVARNR